EPPGDSAPSLQPTERRMPRPSAVEKRGRETIKSMCAAAQISVKKSGHCDKNGRAARAGRRGASDANQLADTIVGCHFDPVVLAQKPTTLEAPAPRAAL